MSVKDYKFNPNQVSGNNIQNNYYQNNMNNNLENQSN
jgi:hypothetical protein